MEQDLNPKEILFVENYIRTHNATESYCIAYEQENRNLAGVEAHRILRKPKISKYYGNRIKSILDSDLASTDSLLMSLYNMALGEETDDILIHVGEGVQEITQVRVPSRERRQAREYLLKTLRNSEKDSLEIARLRLQNEKLRKELTESVSMEDKLDVIIEGFDSIINDTDKQA